jgi:prepilin-type processing-associated H-X9-DG protein
MLLHLAATLLPALVGERRAMCQDNEKWLGLAFQRYAREHRGDWPALSRESGLLKIDWKTLEARYLCFRSILVCSSDEHVNSEAVMAGTDPGSYYYLGYVIRDQIEMEAFAEAYRARVANEGTFDEDLPVPAEHGGGFIHRLSEAFRGFPDVDVSTIPVLFERAPNHTPEGMNVLYMDGSVKYLRMGESFPATQAALDLLKGLEEWQPAEMESR